VLFFITCFGISGLPPPLCLIGKGLLTRSSNFWRSLSYPYSHLKHGMEPLRTRQGMISDRTWALVRRKPRVFRTSGEAIFRRSPLPFRFFLCYKEEMSTLRTE